MRPNILFTLFKPTSLAKGLLQALSCQQGEIHHHHFPDGEFLLTIKTPCKNQSVIIFHQFQNPTQEILPLFFLAKTLRDLGASQIGFIAPYLPYMRQDTVFEPGQGISAKYFSTLLSSLVDWMMTVAPHLHRIHALSNIYRIPTIVAPVNNLFSKWIQTHIPTPLIIGPDIESETLAQSVAKDCQAPYLVLNKERLNDFSVQLAVPTMTQWKNHIPVIIDDIISTGQTQLQVLTHLATAHLPPAICMATHGIFCANAMDALQTAHTSQIITSNSLPQKTNQIDLTSCLAHAIKTQL